ncbi:MAG: hypothetical protein OEY94_05090 [Alphaproteobacteria bacterium]|nr:hypothetical protein [Alphaproteobacteria bacterium]
MGTPCTFDIFHKVKDNPRAILKLPSEHLLLLVEFVNNPKNREKNFKSEVVNVYGDNSPLKMAMIIEDVKSGRCSVEDDEDYKRLFNIGLAVWEIEDKKENILKVLRGLKPDESKGLGYEKVRNRAWKDVNEVIRLILKEDIEGLNSKETLYKTLKKLSSGPFYQEEGKSFFHGGTELNTNLITDLKSYKLLVNQRIYGRKGDTYNIVTPLGHNVMARLEMLREKPKSTPEPEVAVPGL